MQPLPIDSHLEQAMATLASAGKLVLVAEPGAGKTTRVPPALIDRGVVGEGHVLVLLPRRVAARMAAARIAEERGDRVGGFAGYTIRFERRVSAATRVHVVTEGVFTRMAIDDPSLSGIAAVILDEFHERSLHADLGLALVRSIQRDLRPDLKIVVMSATIDPVPLATWLDGAPIVRVPGRTHPVTVTWLDAPDARPIPIRAAAAVRRALSETTGDMLVFLPGVGEIARTAEALEVLAREQALDLLPLHGELPPEDQDRALAAGPRRRVILATNVAETSLTVPGVTTVVDTGYARLASSDPDTGLDRLELRRISKASATQRAGRAGRLGPGRAYRVWSKNEEAEMPPYEVPEIQRVDLAPTVLELRAFGESDVASFPWYEPPRVEALDAATELLKRLGATDPAGRFTEVGRTLARIPAHPRLARLLMEGHRRGALSAVAVVAALLSERDLVERGQTGLPTGPCDLLARRDLLREGRSGDVRTAVARRIKRIAEQLEAMARRELGPERVRTEDEEEAVRKALLVAYPDRVARRRAKGTAEAVMVGGRGITLAPESVVRDAELFVVLDADLGNRGARASALARRVTAIEPEWLMHIGEGIREERTVEWDGAAGRVQGYVKTLFEDLTLTVAATGRPPQDQARDLLFRQARLEPHRVVDPTGSLSEKLVRLALLREWVPELGAPEITPEMLVEQMKDWVQDPVSFQDLAQIPLHDVFASLLSREVAEALEREVPETLLLPSGQHRRLEYAIGKPPVLAVKLQELFGVAATPRIARGRVPVLLHLLSPGRQIVQVTSDLESFWNTTYVQVRKDLRGRYPKHPWPLDPWTAPPSARAKPRGT